VPLANFPKLFSSAAALDARLTTLCATAEPPQDITPAAAVKPYCPTPSNISLYVRKLFSSSTER
jgi:hypothetical protein